MLLKNAPLKLSFMVWYISPPQVSQNRPYSPMVHTAAYSKPNPLVLHCSMLVAYSILPTYQLKESRQQLKQVSFVNATKTSFFLHTNIFLVRRLCVTSHRKYVVVPISNNPRRGVWGSLIYSFSGWRNVDPVQLSMQLYTYYRDGRLSEDT